MAINFDIRDPKNQKLIMTFLLPVVALAAFFQFMIKPKITDLKSQKTELTTIQKQLNQVQKSLQSQEKLREEKENLTIKLKEMESLLPEEENIAVLLSQFSMAEKDANVYLVGFNAAETVEGDDKPYRANKYRLTVEAGYHQFADFISKVMALPRIMSFSELRITMNPQLTEGTESYEGMESQPRHLKVECLLTTYLFKNLPVEKSEK